MKPYCQLIITVLLGCVFVCGCSSKPGSAPAQAAKQYDFRGVIVALNKDKSELRVKHEDIPGYMRGMTMDFPVRDAARFNSVAVGDAITAKLNVAGAGEYWLSDIRKDAAPARQ